MAEIPIFTLGTAFIFFVTLIMDLPLHMSFFMSAFVFYAFLGDLMGTAYIRADKKNSILRMMLRNRDHSIKILQTELNRIYKQNPIKLKVR